jgi:hypothetical protein
MIELELLAFAWAAKKAAAFLEGISFELFSDHKPLKPILEDNALSDIDNKRLQRLKMKVDHLQFTVRWIPGKENVKANALSRAPIYRATPDDEIDDDNEINAVEICLNQDEGLKANILDAFTEELQEAAQKDEDHKTVIKWATKNLGQRCKSSTPHVLTRTGEFTMNSVLKTDYCYMTAGLWSPRRLGKGTWTGLPCCTVHQRKWSDASGRACGGHTCQQTSES